MIQSYTAITPKQQTLGAMVLVRPYGWFFKITGPESLVQPQAATFEEFVKSLKFSRDLDSEPSWKLPEGWKQDEGNELRFATIKIGTDNAPLEMSVTKLPMRGGDDEEYILANVNRWRGEVGLAPLAAAQLSTATKRAELGSFSATLVSLVGTGSSSPTTGNPYEELVAEMERMGPPTATQEAPAATVQFKLPTGWREVAPKQFQSHRFEVGEKKETVEISISQLPAGGGDFAANVNRWRAQVQLDPATSKEIEASSPKMEIGGLEGRFLEMVGTDQAGKPEAILGVIAPSPGGIWFFKLRGPAKQSMDQKAKFQEFIKSIKFGETKKAERKSSS